MSSLNKAYLKGATDEARRRGILKPEEMDAVMGTLHEAGLRAVAEPADHLKQDGFVHYLTKNSSGEWWVSTRKDGEPWASCSLKFFLQEDGV